MRQLNGGKTTRYHSYGRAQVSHQRALTGKYSPLYGHLVPYLGVLLLLVL